MMLRSPPPYLALTDRLYTQDWIIVTKPYARFACKDMQRVSCALQAQHMSLSYPMIVVALSLSTAACARSHRPCCC
jgi:hypothetical protein